MEGFVKVLKKDNLPEVKRYFFYLTHSDRAKLIEIDNQPKSESKFNQNVEISTNNPLLSYWDYRSAVNKEWKKNRIKNLEIIFSYSIQFNYIMSNVLGKEKWEKNYENIVINILKKYFKNKKIMNYFHKFDSSGYRYHNHTLIYPYLNNDKSVSDLYTHVPEKVLKNIKIEFAKYAQLLSEKYKKEILSFVKSESNNSNIKDVEFQKLFLKHNPDLKDNFNIF